MVVLISIVLLLLTHGLDLVLSSPGSDKMAEEAKRVEQSQHVVKAKGHRQ